MLLSILEVKGVAVQYLKDVNLGPMPAHLFLEANLELLLYA